MHTLDVKGFYWTFKIKDMILNMGQQLSIPFIIAGIILIIFAMSRPKLEMKFPNKFCDSKK